MTWRRLNWPLIVAIALTLLAHAV
ncbi:hypothetical protein LCGC14_1730840, partial [marine sediment metagenome]